MISIRDVPYTTGADPGLPIGGGADLRVQGGGGAPTYDFVKFSRKLHEIEKTFWPRGMGRGLMLWALLDPPMYYHSK